MFGHVVVGLIYDLANEFSEEADVLRAALVRLRQHSSRHVLEHLKKLLVEYGHIDLPAKIRLRERVCCKGGWPGNS